MLIPTKTWLYNFYRTSEIDETFSTYPQRIRVMRVAEALRRYLPPVPLVVDIGCGDGIGSAAVLEGIRGFRFIGVDYSADKLAKLDKHLRVTGRLVGDGEVLPLRSSSVDAVLCMETVEHLPAPMTALREFHRVVKPNGRVILTVPLSGTLHEPLVRAYHWLRRQGDGFTPHLHFFTLRGIRRMVTGAGFRILESRGHAFECFGMGNTSFERYERLDRAFRQLPLGLTGKPERWMIGHTFMLLVLAKE